MRKLLTFITLSLLLFSCADKKEKVKEIEKIVSLAPSITETLFALKQGEKLVAVTSYCDYPEQVKTLPKVGGLFDTSVEQIYSVKPDLIVHLPSQQKTADSLQKLGLNTFSISQNSLQEIRQSIHSLGKKLNCKGEAEKLTKTLELKPVNKTGKNPKVLVVISRDMTTSEISDAYLASENTWYGDLIKMAGGESAVKGRIPYPSFSKEGIIEVNPDIIVEIMPQADKKQITIDQVRAIWSNSLPELNAVKDEQIYMIKGLYAVRPGPRYPQLFEDLKLIINKE